MSLTSGNAYGTGRASSAVGGDSGGGGNKQDAAVPTAPSLDPSPLCYSETSFVTLEWHLSGLKSIFDGSRGESKSKCIKSAVFGDKENLWEVIFYPNSGGSGTVAGSTTAAGGSGGGPTPPAEQGVYCSFYLSAVPTEDEKARSIKGKWTRNGLYGFRFEIKPTTKNGVIVAKEASNHQFNHKTLNWGWNSFARRDTLYYQAPPAIRSADAFLIVCTVAATPTPPAGAWLGLPAPVIPYTQAPTSAFATHSSGPGNNGGGGWTGSDGAWRGVGAGMDLPVVERVPRALIDAVGALFDDPLYSDVEFVLPLRRTRGRAVGGGKHAPRTSITTTTTSTDSPEQTLTAQVPTVATGPIAAAHRRIFANKRLLKRSEYFEAMFEGGFSEGSGLLTTAGVETFDARLSAEEEEDDEEIADDSDMEEEALSDDDDQDRDDTRRRSTQDLASLGPKKAQVVVRDAACRTWQALLYYLYTDMIVFAPLASTFMPEGVSRDTDSASGAGRGSTRPATNESIRERRAWIRTWRAERMSGPSGGGGQQLKVPEPCSAKAIYRLADKFDLPALRQRAFAHIVSQLTVENIPYEAFSSFSAMYEEVRKVEVAFFLSHWDKIKGSAAMQNIWSDIRQGRHAGFEQIWPHIIGSLHFRPEKERPTRPASPSFNAREDSD